MKETLAHPLVASRINNLIRLISTYGFEPRYLPRMLYIFSVSLILEPLRIYSSARFRKTICRQELRPDLVFIIGHWRSGTTHLQNVMSRDPQFGHVSLLQAAMPNEFLSLPDSIKQSIGRSMPKKRLMDNVPVDAKVPWEEELALTANSRLSFYHVSFFPKGMTRIFNESILFNGNHPELIAEWKRTYMEFLKKVQYTQPDKPLLLKNPANTARIPLLRTMFPDAKYVHIHRNPYEVFSSSVHLYLQAQKAWGLHTCCREDIATHILETYPKLMNAYLQDKELLDPSHLTDVRFDDLQKEPIQTLQKIYHDLNLSGFEHASLAFEKYLQSQSNYKKNRFTLDETEKKAIGGQWASFFDAFGYTR